MACNGTLQDREFKKFRTSPTTDECAVGVVVENDVASAPVGLGTTALHTEVTIDDTSWTALPATALTDRKLLAIQNQTGFEIKVTPNSPQPAGYSGWTIIDGGEKFYNITDGLTYYAKAEAGSGSIVIDVEEIG